MRATGFLVFESRRIRGAFLRPQAAGSYKKWACVPLN